MVICDSSHRKLIHCETSETQGRCSQGRVLKDGGHQNMSVCWWECFRKEGLEEETSEVGEGEAREDAAKRTSGGLAPDRGRGSSSIVVTSRHHKLCHGLPMLICTSLSLGSQWWYWPFSSSCSFGPINVINSDPKTSLEHGVGVYLTFLWGFLHSESFPFNLVEG